MRINTFLYVYNKTPKHLFHLYTLFFTSSDAFTTLTTTDQRCVGEERNAEKWLDTTPIHTTPVTNKICFSRTSHTKKHTHAQEYEHKRTHSHSTGKGGKVTF